LKYQPVPALQPIELPEPLAGILPFTPSKLPSTSRSPAANEQPTKIPLPAATSSFNYFACFEKKIKRSNTTIVLINKVESKKEPLIRDST